MYINDYNQLVEDVSSIQAGDKGIPELSIPILADFIYYLYHPMSESTEEHIDQYNIIRVSISLMDFLLVKNQRYGNSALKPIQVFSKVSNAEQINNRMDDKLMRINNSHVERKNDYIDLTGYLHLKCIMNEWFNLKDLLD